MSVILNYYTRTVFDQVISSWHGQQRGLFFKHSAHSDALKLKAINLYKAIFSTELVIDIGMRHCGRPSVAACSNGPRAYT